MRNAGLTLLELIVFLAITTLLSGTAAFGFRELSDKWLLRGAVRQVVLDLRIARVRSISESRPHRLRFEPAAKAYEQEERTDSGAYVATETSRRLPTGVRIVGCTGRNASIDFRARGNASSFGTITLRGARGNTKEIVVDMVGRIRVRR